MMAFFNPTSNYQIRSKFTRCGRTHTANESPSHLISPCKGMLNGFIYAQRKLSPYILRIWYSSLK